MSAAPLLDDHPLVIETMDENDTWEQSFADLIDEVRIWNIALNSVHHWEYGLITFPSCFPWQVGLSGWPQAVV